MKPYGTACGGKHDLTPIKAVVHGFLKNMDRRIESPIAELSTGFPGLDAITGGIQQGQVVVVTGERQTPTSSFYAEIIRHITIESKTPSGIILPFGERQNLLEHMVAQHCRVPATKMLSGHLSRDDMIALDAGLAVITEAPVWFVSFESVCAKQFGLACHRLKEEKSVKVVFLDFNQRIWFDGSNGCSMITRAQRFEACLIELKRVAVELEISILVRKGPWLERKTKDQKGVRTPVRFGGEEAVNTILQMVHEPFEPGANRHFEVCVATGSSGHAGSVVVEFDSEFMGVREC